MSGPDPDDPRDGGAPPAPPADGWRRLDRRTIVVTALRLAGLAVVAGIPAVAGLTGTVGPGWAILAVAGGAALLIAAGTGAEYVRWRRTRYRVLPERFELRRGILVTTRRSLNRDRIRSVDITAPPLLRLFSLAQVRIGTAERTGAGESALALLPITRTDAEELRTTLLHRPVGDRGAAGSGDPAEAGGADGTDGGDTVPGAPGSGDTVPGAPGHGVLATFQPSWVRFAPVSVLTPALGAAAFGAVLQVAEWLGMQDGVISWVLDRLRALPLPTAVLLVVLTGLTAGVLGSIAVFVELWWRFRLEREPTGTLRVRRGLLTTRSVSLEERRLRGVELLEPLGNRLLGAARVDAVATGLSEQSAKSERTEHKTLLPPAPRWDADRVVAAVLRERVSPTESVGLRRHPRAARGRRVRWALSVVAAPVLTTAMLGLTGWTPAFVVAALLAAVGVPVAIALAFEAYANLGHGLTGGYLVARNGSVLRRTVALRRRGVIGWTARQSIFQRRRGLLTLTATTAAGTQGYSVYDVGMSEGLRFAEAAVPDLFGPFLEPADGSRPDQDRRNNLEQRTDGA